MLAPFRSRGFRPYLVGLLGIALATGLRYVFDPWLGEHLSFSFDYLAVFVAAWTGGILPAIATALVSALLSDYLFTPSLDISSVEELLDLIFFVAVSVIIGALCEATLRALARAKGAEQEKDRLMATVAHEMRSPLSVIYYASSMTRMAGHDSPTDQLDVIDRQVHRLNVMIEELLDVSRVQRGKIRLKRQLISASEIVAGAVERSRPLIENHKHRLKVELPPYPITLFVDQTRMEQVLTNLLTNAAKYTPDGGEIAVRATIESGSAILAVRDNGIGIVSEMLPRLFDFFVQSEAAQSRAEGGLGIGLALARKIAEMHGGTVRATSGGRNHGSEFIVSLPLGEPATTRAALAGA